MSILEELFEDSSNQQINEITKPYSRTSSAINRAKSSVKGLVGGGQYEQGAEQAGQLANSMFLGFKRYIGTKYGKKPQFVTYDDVAKYMQANNMDTKLLGTNKNMTFTPKDVATIFLKGAQEMSSRMGDEPVQAQQPQAQGQGQAPQEQPQQAPQPQQASGLQGTLSSLSSEQRDQLLKILSKLQ